MGFFKKAFKGIGKGIKKIGKQVSFKNLVKIGAGFDPTGIVSGMQANHEAKKEERLALAQMEAENLAMAQMSNTEKVEALNNQMVNATLVRGTGIRDVLTGALGGALSGAGGILAGDTTVVNATSNLADNTIMATLKKNAWKYLGILLVGTLIIIGTVKLFFKPKKRGKW